MSKQYLTTHTTPSAHPTDIYTLSITPHTLLSASGSSTLTSHSLDPSSNVSAPGTSATDTTTPFPLLQTLPPAHKLGCHHVCASASGNRAVSVGFGGEVRVWAFREGGEEGGGEWAADGEVKDQVKAGEVWAPALSGEGRYLAATTFDGRVNVWDLESEDRERIRVFQTRGGFGGCIDMSHDSTHLATGHHSGALYIFANASGALLHSLPSLHTPVRAVRFSPASTLLAAAGDSASIALYDARRGEQVALLRGHASWVMALDWSGTGEWLASADWGGTMRVWSVERGECVSVVRNAGGVARGGGGGRCVWAVRWLPRRKGGAGEGFVVAGAAGDLVFYREAAGS